MKTRSLFIGMLLLLVLMGACNSGSVMTQATGFAYEVVVVMDQKDWKGPAGEAISLSWPLRCPDCRKPSLL